MDSQTKNKLIKIDQELSRHSREIINLRDRINVSQVGTGASVGATPQGGTLFHGSLLGLDQDDHSQYIHTSQARQIVIAHTFNPTGAPFIIGANAQDQFVDGLNSDQLDSQEGTWYRDRANHTGTQVAATISDFDIEVENNPEVALNILKRHDRLHDVLDTLDHSVLGNKWQVLGLSAANTLDLLTPRSDPNQDEAILKTNVSGQLNLSRLNIREAGLGTDKWNFENQTSQLSILHNETDKIRVSDSRAKMENIDIEFDTDFGIYANGTNLFKIFPRKSGITGLTGGEDAPFASAMGLFADSAVVMAESDLNEVKGWFDVNNSNFRWKGNAQIDNQLDVDGPAVIDDDLTVGPLVLFVDVSGQRVGINTAPDPQFSLDVVGNTRTTGYFVGRHAIQLDNVSTIFHYDGPTRENSVDGSVLGIRGEQNRATAPGGIIFRPGLFNKAVQLADAMQNLVLNSSFENGLTRWPTWGAPLIKEAVASGFYSDNCLRVLCNPTLDNQGAYQDIPIVNGAKYTVSCYVKFNSGQPVMMLDSTHGFQREEADLSWENDGKWHRISFTFTALDGSVRVHLGKPGAGIGEAGEFFFDGVQLEETPYETPYGDGSFPGHSFAGAEHDSISTREATSLTYSSSLLNPLRCTVMFWVKLPFNAPNTDLPPFRRLFEFGEFTSPLSKDWIAIIFDEDYDKLQFHLKAVWAGTSYLIEYSGTPWNDGEWVHVAMSWEQDTAFKAYINGELIGSVADPIPPQDTSETSVFAIGRQVNNSLYHPGVWIDELVIVNEQIDDDEVLTIYESEAPVFAESTTWSWSNPNVTTWVDEEGLWSRSKNGQEAFAISNVDNKSWGGLTLDQGDILIGKSPEYILWDDDSASLKVQGTITIQNPGDINTSEINDDGNLGGTAVWGNITGTGKPDDNATFGADWSTNLLNIPGTLGTPSGSGLFLSATHLGYYDSGNWETFMDNQGNFYLAGTNGVFQYVASTSDLLLGNLGGANIIWDQSDGIFRFRQGTTTKASIDTDGAITAGGDSLKLDNTGLTIHSDTLIFLVNDAIKFRSDVNNRQDLNIFTTQFIGGTARTGNIQVPSVSGVASTLFSSAEGSSTSNGYNRVRSSGYNRDANLHLECESGVAYAALSGSNFSGLVVSPNTTGGLLPSQPDALLDVRVTGNQQGVKADDAFVGRGGFGVDYAHFSHWDRSGINQYALLQHANGTTHINSYQNNLYLRISHSEVMRAYVNGAITVSPSGALYDTTTYKLQVDGSFRASGQVRGATLYSDGAIFANGGTQVHDLAEYMNSNVFESGYIIQVSKEGEFVEKTQREYDGRACGVVSSVSTATLVMGRKGGMRAPIALSGLVRCKVLVTTDIRPGDPITTSNISGVGMKATEPGCIVGFARQWVACDNEEGEVKEVLVYLNFKYIDEAHYGRLNIT